MESYLNTIWTFFKMESCVPVAKLAVCEKKYWHCGQSTYCIWFCSDNFHCWVFLPCMGLFHQQFLKTIFAFSNMWQLRIWYLDINVLFVPNELFFNMLLRAWMHGKKSELHKYNLKRFSYMWQTPSFSFPIRFCYKKNTLLQRSGAGRIVSMF